MAGPGTELKKLLGGFGIRDNKKCGCDKYAAKMDAKGVEWCRKKRSTIVAWLRSSAKKRGVAFSHILAGLLVDWAIRRATKD